ncbi:MAG TPA: leucyl aminopeptidase [Rhodocyclaceae bacterium]|nr:leucyl aminopeptidase [Rhodocyclaceae bacterium]
MEFSIKSGSLEKARSACLVVGVFEDGKLAIAADAIGKTAHRFLEEMLEHGDMQGKAGTTLLLYKVPGIDAVRVLLVGLGKEKEFKSKEYRSAVSAALKRLNESGCDDATLHLTELHVKKRDLAWKIRQTILLAHESLYRCDRLKSTKETGASPLTHIVCHVAQNKEVAAAEAALAEGVAIAQGMDLARNLGDLPGNICTPSYLAAEAQRLGAEQGLRVEVLDRADMEKLGMNTLLSVARGSHEAPKFIIMHHTGGGDAKPIVLVGKGVTFDSGGISLKPGADMDEMKYDMSGAGSVLGTLKAAALLKLPLNLIGVVPATENMPGGSATKPGDIIASLSGQTIEILNTDAEGRLILCDALTYVERFDPECVIDIATLTGACVIALGHVVHGLFGNDDELTAELFEAGQEAYDRAWQLPLWDDYQEQLKSNFADMANIGGRPGGSITAACFLSRFAKKYTWAHLDIAGTAWRSGKEKGSTGRPVPLLTQFLLQRAHKSGGKAKHKRA